MTTRAKPKKRANDLMRSARSTRPQPKTGAAVKGRHRFRFSSGLLFGLLLAVFTFALYSPVLKHPFVNYDDPDYVTENVHVQQGLSFSTLDWAFGATVAANWHPLTWLSHALDCELFGLNAEGHHFVSLLLHCLNSVLVFWLLFRSTQKTLSSLFVAALFALHPLNVECVAWVAERKSVLSLLFFLLSLAAYGWYAQRPCVKKYLLMVGLFALSLMAKPMAVTFPFVLMLMDVWPLQRVAAWSPPSPAFSVPQFSVRQLILEKVPLVGLAAVSSLITLVVQRPAIKTISAIPLRERLANALYSYFLYLRNAVWPLHLGVFYAPQGSQLGAGRVIVCLLFLGTVSGLVWWARSRPYLLVGWLWFLGTLVPMIGIVQVGEQGMADRYAYLPLLGIFVMVVLGTAELCANNRVLSWVAVAGGCAVLVALSALTWRQIATWESSYALWSHSLQITKENYVAEDFVGFALLEQGANSTGQQCIDEALLHFRNAVAINQQDTLGHLNIGFCQQVRGKFQEAVNEYRIAANSTHSRFLQNKGYKNLGSVFEQMGDYASAKATYEKALQVFPNDPELAARLRSLDHNSPAEAR